MSNLLFALANSPDHHHHPLATQSAPDTLTSDPATASGSLPIARPPTTTVVPALWVRIAARRIVVFQRSMTGSLTPVQARHLQILMLNDFLVPLYHGPPLVIMAV